ncbi:hypothetical protein M885DRAFT_522050 [Pelagophyceae sp. CCMP2097]|nr:hypothetical protein M885DRAFT_522050 [Pelagophyceae sp. CCMP2097]|mmetsp:Transcript_4370/g.15365  ORF Transcript_4370/g.15365 Transcript_4370/m.15365 type:complete len:503 (+) Transcript_4370:128-1636(+)
MRRCALLVTLAFLRCEGAGRALDPSVQPNLVLWLTADRGVEVTAATQTVLRWTDQSGGGYVFAPLAAAQHRAASARFYAAVSKQRQRQQLRDASPPADVAQGFAARLDTAAKAVTFPAPLVANDVQLRDGVTAFFVLRPKWLEDGDQAVGQRFFGHYPYGQFRFHDGRLAFKTEGGDYVHSADDIAQNELVVAAYRFDGDVAISLDGLPFERIESPRRGGHRAPVFSAAGYVTLGGCPPYNSFIGDVAEVMVFGVPLSDADARHVLEVLAERHGVSLRRSHGDASTPSRNSGAPALPQRHEAPADRRAAPALPAIAGLLELPPEAGEHRQRLHDSATDRLTIYKRLKGHRQRSEDAAAGLPSQAEAQHLLDQLQEAQARLNELQSAVANGGQAPARASLRGASAPAAVATGAPPPPAPASAGGRDPCYGGDAFDKIAVAKWPPPQNAPLEQIQQWDAARLASESAIKAFPRGGKELRTFVHNQVADLRLLRHNMFCALLREF